jgi:hypothetical protein
MHRAWQEFAEDLSYPGLGVELGLRRLGLFDHASIDQTSLK